MPATVTHAYFALDIYAHLPIGLKKLLIDDKEKLKMFAQSMDAMYFYRIFTPQKGKRIRAFGHYFHRNDSQKFFINLVNYIKYNGYYKNGDVMAFLYGMIAHYALDSTIHPFIIYETGNYDKNDKSTRQYRNLHDEAETLLDLAMIHEREKTSPHSFRIDTFCFDLKPFSKELKEVIDYSFKETFDVHTMSKFYYQALKDMKRFLRLFRYDKIGIKRFGYSVLEGITLGKTFHFHVISYHMPLKKKNLYRNLEHEEWSHPAKFEEKHTTSFDDLYKEALNKAMKIIGNVNNYFQDKKKVNLEKVFLNHSYITGKDCSEELPLKYRKERH